MWFRFVNSEESYHHFKVDFIRFTPKFAQSIWFPQNGAKSFDEVKTRLIDWLTNELKFYWTEQYDPDFWEHFETDGNNFISDSIDYESDEQFSDIEKEEVKLALNDVRIRLLNEYNFTPVQVQLIESRILYLEQNLDTKSKLDWKNLAIGAIISLILNLSVDTELGDQIWKLFISVFESIPKIM